MSTAPRGSILFRYTPGVGRVAALDCCGTSGGTSPTSTTATAFSTSTQTMVAGTAANIAHDTVPFAYGGITVVTGAFGYFQVPTAGVYKLIPSIQYKAAGNGKFTVWIKVNGSNVTNSATLLDAPNNTQGVFTTEILLELNANDQVQIWGLATSFNLDVTYLSGGGVAPNAYPAAPGIITNMYRIR